MEHDAIDQRLVEAATEYHRPPAPPRREMWLRIQAARAAQHAQTGPEPRPQPLPRHGISPWVWSAGIAAALVLGLGIGRLSMHSSRPDETAAVSDLPTAEAAAYRYAMIEHLNQADAFLTRFQTPARRADTHPLTIATARQLLATNRLLLDSPAAANQNTRFLLEDVELVLARIVQLSPETRVEDRNLITESMDRVGILARLRLQVPGSVAPPLGNREPS